MRFPDTMRPGSDAHETAVARLDSAREKREELSATAEAARGTPAESIASREFEIASDDESARAAWLAWVELGD